MKTVFFYHKIPLSIDNKCAMNCEEQLEVLPSNCGVGQASRLESLASDGFETSPTFWEVWLCQSVLKSWGSPPGVKNRFNRAPGNIPEPMKVVGPQPHHLSGDRKKCFKMLLVGHLAGNSDGPTQTLEIDSYLVVQIQTRMYSMLMHCTFEYRYYRYFRHIYIYICWNKQRCNMRLNLKWYNYFFLASRDTTVCSEPPSLQNTHSSFGPLDHCAFPMRFPGEGW